MKNLTGGHQARIRIKGCPRCGGDLFLESFDAKGKFAQEKEWRCLQCARTVPAPSKETSLSFLTDGRSIA